MIWKIWSLFLTFLLAATSSCLILIAQDKWHGLDNSELAQIVECLPSDSALWLSADQALEKRKGHGN